MMTLTTIFHFIQRFSFWGVLRISLRISCAKGASAFGGECRGCGMEEQRNREINEPFGETHFFSFLRTSFRIPKSEIPHLKTFSSLL
jgi:hypothetical protein